MEMKLQWAAMSLLLLSLLVQEALAHGNNGPPLFKPKRLEMFVDELPEMQRLQAFGFKDGATVTGNLTIGMYDTFWKFHRDLPPSRVFAYGVSKETASVPGPTIEAIHGVPTYIAWNNHLPSCHFLPWDKSIGAAMPPSGVPTVVHLHGGVQPPSSDGGSQAWFTQNFSHVGLHFTSPVYHYLNVQPAGNLWYHDHAMGLTRVNLLAGLLGAYRISSKEEEPLGLPSGPEFDRHLVLFDREFYADGSIYMNPKGNNPSLHPQWQPEYFGRAIIVNGKAWPFLSVRRRRYRFRILNASNARFFNLSFSNGLHFIHIASDSMYLPKPVKTRSFLLAPSEIADVVVNFAESSTDSAVLLNHAPFPYPSGDETDDINGRVMKVVIEKQKEVDPYRVPHALLRYKKPEVNTAVQTRYVTMYEYTTADDEPTHLYLNAKSFDEPVTETPREGTSEIWNVINLTEDNHPLHFHLALFSVLKQREISEPEKFKDCMRKLKDAEKCGIAKHVVGKHYRVPRYERGWKNVFKMRPGCMTTIFVRFKLLLVDEDEAKFPFNATGEPGYVYHCHILDHEDNEMMRPFRLLP